MYWNLEHWFFHLFMPSFFPGFDNLSQCSGKDQIHGRIKCSIANCWRVCLFYLKASNQALLFFLNHYSPKICSFLLCSGGRLLLPFFTFKLGFTYFLLLSCTFFFYYSLACLFALVALFCGLNLLSDIAS